MSSKYLPHPQKKTHTHTLKIQVIYALCPQSTKKTLSFLSNVPSCLEIVLEDYNNSNVRPVWFGLFEYALYGVC